MTRFPQKSEDTRLQAKSSYKTITILEKNPDLPEDNLLPLIGPEKALSNNTFASGLTAAFFEKVRGSWN